MGLKIDFENKARHGHFCKPGVRLYLTPDGKRLVEADDPEARTLYCTEHKEVPLEEFERLLENSRVAAEPDDEVGDGGEDDEEAREEKQSRKRGKGK